MNPIRAWLAQAALYILGVLLILCGLLLSVCLVFRAQRNEAVALNGVMRVQLDQANASIQAQNKGIEQLKALGEAQARQVAKSSTRAEKIHEATEAKVQAVLLSPAPKEPDPGLDWLIQEVLSAADERRRGMK